MIDSIKERVCDIMANLTDYPENLIDRRYAPILPFEGGEEIKLIILGQDPTVKNDKSRDKINVTLNLDKEFALKKYIENICNGIGVDLKNVYATNVFKYFYSVPPAQTMTVLKNHLAPNIELLQDELNLYQNCPIITLGEPVLKLLKGDSQKVRIYWGYNGTEYSKTHWFEHSLFPFPHQPSIRKIFYKDNQKKYIEFVKEEITR